VSQLLIFLTATQRTQRLKKFTSAAVILLSVRGNLLASNCLTKICQYVGPRRRLILRCERCAAVSHLLKISHSDTTNTAPGGFCFRDLAPLFILRCGRCAAVSHLLIISHSDTANTAVGGFCFRDLASPLHSALWTLCRREPPSDFSHSDTTNTALGTFSFAISRPLSILRCGRCAAVSHLLIFLTATQRTQRLETFGFAISRPSSFRAVDAVPL